MAIDADCNMEDAVCNMEVDASDAKFHSQYESENFQFGSEECKDTFDEQPESFAASSGSKQVFRGGRRERLSLPRR
jgi:YHS domain-containing protein